jgi:hypothetical protein
MRLIRLVTSEIGLVCRAEVSFRVRDEVNLRFSVQSI